MQFDSQPRAIAGPAGSARAALATNKVIRNTYLLLAMTLAFSALTAAAAMAMNLPHPGLVITLVGYFGLLFLTTKFRDRALGLAFVFALTGFMGYTLGPLLNLYLGMPNGPQLVMTALGATGAVFLALSGYALTSRKDFSFIGGFLMVGILVAFLAGLGGETNSIMATVTLYVSIFNLFTSLLQLLGFANRE